MTPHERTSPWTLPSICAATAAGSCLAWTSGHAGLMRFGPSPSAIARTGSGRRSKSARRRMKPGAPNASATGAGAACSTPCERAGSATSPTTTPPKWPGSTEELTAALRKQLVLPGNRRRLHRPDDGAFLQFVDASRQRLVEPCGHLPHSVRPVGHDSNPSLCSGESLEGSPFRSGAERASLCFGVVAE